MFYCGCCLAFADRQAGLVAADMLAVRRWWMEERGLVLMCQLVKTAEVYQYVGSSSQTEDRSLKVLICCVGFLHL